MRIIELIIDEEAELYGIDAISIVSEPAINSSFIALNDNKLQLAEVDSERHILLGAALIPDKPIYRNQNGEEFHVYFSKRTVRRAMELFLKFGNQNNSTLEHEHKLNGLSVVESWIVESKKNDKINHYDIDVPVGTWMVSVKVENEAIWDEWVKEKKVSGFSIEGFFCDRFKAQQDAKMMEELTEILEDSTK
ncbi:MAG: XkdF-like putative serine protease domain-containing protein [Cyanophyceae cyanobacterium]